MRTSRIAVAFAAAALTVSTLSGCAAIVALEPAADADDPGCADVTVRLPDTVGDQERRETNAQATGAWGDPASVLLYCGVEVPSASVNRCIEIDGLFWLVDNDDAPTYILTSYGREPAVDVVIDTSVVGSTPVLVDLKRAVSYTVPNGRVCTDLEDSQRLDTNTGSTAP